jgi:hypothetical protein
MPTTVNQYCEAVSARSRIILMEPELLFKAALAQV